MRSLCQGLWVDLHNRLILQRSFLSALMGYRVSNRKVRLQVQRDFGPLMSEL